jgi:hypothetical protein
MCYYAAEMIHTNPYGAEGEQRALGYATYRELGTSQHYLLFRECAILVERVFAAFTRRIEYWINQYKKG